MTLEEWKKAYDGQHVRLTCKNHTDLFWSCKRVSTTLYDDGVIRYNQQRNLFFFGPVDREECDCPTSDLYVVIEEEKATQ